jgi:hypothetical protein
MKTKRILTAAAIALTSLSLVFAGEEASFGFDEGSFASDDSFSSDSFGFDDSSFGSSEESAPALTFSGSASADARFYLHDFDENAIVSSNPEMKLAMNYATDKVDFEAKLRVNSDILTSSPEDVLDELTVRGYLGDFVVEAGKMRNVWGKGDKLHVLDNFNSNDYTDFVIPDYIDRRVALPMVKVAYNGFENVRLEGVYTPYMTPDKYSTTGVWVPASYSNLYGAIETAAGTQAAIVYSQTSAATSNAALATAKQTMYLNAVNNQTGLNPNTKTLKYGQAGLRATGTVGSFDWGASYFVGRMKQPSVNQAALQAWIQNPGVATSPLEYDLVQVFGLEGATIVGPFNTRAELAYNMTNDFDGTDANVHNNSISWVAGFDIDLPLGNLNLNLQENGSVLLGKNGIDDNGALDVDYDAKGRISNNKVVCSISDSFFHEKLSAEANFIYGIERGDFVLMPKAEYTVAEGLDFSLSGMYIYTRDENSEFASFKDNSFVQAKLVYSF